MLKEIIISVIVELIQRLLIEHIDIILQFLKQLFEFLIFLSKYMTIFHRQS